ncbi:hypothetical protein [Erythrobacter tepidarius]|uniref:hypothetical protein n=1 Tax=Erythrobacter tepidarius TaxID=60454 RepID=UPI000A369C8A|nr:hypothetical protein [Erythrobacter tepidarius]
MMGETSMDLPDEATAEAILRHELARETRALGSVVPVLRHLLASEGQRLVSDAVLARVRGMLTDLAAQLIAAGHDGPPEVLAETLAADAALLAFCHALAAESHLAERLHQQRGIDPVLSPLLQELIASDDPMVAELAMTALAAQSRFIQSQRRMQLPLGELPAELFDGVLKRGGESQRLSLIRQSYDEGASRLGLLARLVAAMRRGAVAALALDHAGPALFASALATLAGLPRCHAVLACHEGQGTRLALALRAAGLPPQGIERQFLALFPTAPMPGGLAALSPDRARLLLVAAGTD